MTTSEVQLEAAVEFPAATVVEALVRVVRDLPAVAKDERMDQGQGRGYNYRGIEQMTAAAQPLFGKHGVLVCPEVVETSVEQIIKNEKPWVHRTMKVRYVLRGTNGRDDMISVGPFIAEADDNSDKSANKCMTQAYKQMLLQVLCISDRKDDPDSENRDRDAPKADINALPVGPGSAEPTYARAEADGYTRAELDQVASEATGRPVTLPEVTRGEWPLVRDFWTLYRNAHPRNRPQEPRESPQSVTHAEDPPTAPTGPTRGQSEPSSSSAELGSRARRKE